MYNPEQFDYVGDHMAVYMHMKFYKTLKEEKIQLVSLIVHTPPLRRLSAEFLYYFLQRYVVKEDALDALIPYSWRAVNTGATAACFEAYNWPI